MMVAILDGDAYGVNITHQIVEQTDRAVRLNQVHASLIRLEEKGMVVSKMGEPTAERGGRRKRIYTITAFGQRTLVEIQGLRPISGILCLQPSAPKRNCHEPTQHQTCATAVGKPFSPLVLFT